jgi:hypothetical protein
MGWAIHFWQESRNPFFLWIVQLHAADLGHDGVLALPPGPELVAAAVATGTMGLWSLTTTAAAARTSSTS